MARAWGATTTATTGAQTDSSPVVSVAFESLTGRRAGRLRRGQERALPHVEQRQQRLDEPRPMDPS